MDSRGKTIETFHSFLKFLRSKKCANHLQSVTRRRSITCVPVEWCWQNLMFQLGLLLLVKPVEPRVFAEIGPIEILLYCFVIVYSFRCSLPMRFSVAWNNRSRSSFPLCFHDAPSLQARTARFWALNAAQSTVQILFKYSSLFIHQWVITVGQNQSTGTQSSVTSASRFHCGMCIISWWTSQMTMRWFPFIPIFVLSLASRSPLHLTMGRITPIIDSYWMFSVGECVLAESFLHVKVNPTSKPEYPGNFAPPSHSNDFTKILWEQRWPRKNVHITLTFPLLIAKR